MEAEDRSELASLPIREMLFVGGGVFSISAVANFRSPLLPDIGGELAMSPGQLGLVMTAFAVGRLLTNVPAGILVDRIGVTWIYAISGAVLGIGSTMFALAPTPWWVLAGSAIVGVATAMSMTSGMTYFSGVVGPRYRGRVMSILSASLLGGQAIGPVLSGALADAGTWRTAMVLAAVVGAVIAVGGTTAALRRRSQATAVSAASEGSADPLQLGVRLRVALYAVPFGTMFMMGSLPNTLVPIIG
ncbi:MAG: MFS transporter, partial [Nitriliruptoraceae bacterium]